MKLQLAGRDGLNTFTAYGTDYVSVNGVPYRQNLAVLPDRLIPGWTAATFDTLTLDDFVALAALDAQIVLLGTGNALRFPRPELLQPLVAAQKGIEIMDLRAACRTYNMLASEGRRVVAGLLLA